MDQLENALTPAGRTARQQLLAGLPMTERRIPLAGISTAVLEGGEGPPLVLLHGPGGYAAHFARVFPLLVKHHRIIAPDLPGHGASGPGAEALDAERVLDWLEQLIESTSATRPVLVGQLLGGAIAARFAIDRPQRLSRLVLANSLGLRPFQPAPEFALALTQFMSAPSPQTHEQLWQQCAYDLPRLRQGMAELWEPFEAYNLDRAIPSLQAVQRTLMAEFAFKGIPAQDLAGIEVPTFLIWGRHDLATPLEVAERASVQFGWPLFVIEQSNDDPPVEQPEAFVRALAKALAQSPQPDGRS